MIDDLDKEHTKEIRKKDREIESLHKKLPATRDNLASMQEALREKSTKLYEALTEPEDEKGKTLQLKARINRDDENSSKPSSMSPNRKKIANNRIKTGRKPGGQLGHPGHKRKQHTPTHRINIPAPDEYALSPDYKATGRMITKQLIDIRVDLVINEYSTPEFRHVRTGQRAHGEFPKGPVNDVNYSGNIKSFALPLNNRCNVSVAKVSGFLRDLTRGRLSLSTGMINGLSKSFSMKTEAEQKKAFSDLLLSPVVHTDFISVRVNGQNMNIIVCATKSIVMYFAREHKGHDGVKGKPIESYRNTLVHDHDKTFYNCGDAHQECLDRPLRYLKDSMDNEPHLHRNRQMRGLIQKMIHFRKQPDPGDNRDPDQIDPGKVEEFEASCDKILNLAKQEYEYEPPSKYYKDGLNLYKRMVAYRDNHLLFLHDRRVPYTNSLSERLLRIYKRKQTQVMTFRSWGGLDNLCNSQGVLASLFAQGKNLYKSVASIFDRETNNSRNTTA